MKIFDHGANNQLVGTVTGLPRGVFTVDFSPSGDVRLVSSKRRLVLSGGGGQGLRCLSWTPTGAGAGRTVTLLARVMRSV